jgi:hypothetical protein
MLVSGGASISDCRLSQNTLSPTRSFQTEAGSLSAAQNMHSRSEFLRCRIRLRGKKRLPFSSTRLRFRFEGLIQMKLCPGARTSSLRKSINKGRLRAEFGISVSTKIMLNPMRLSYGRNPIGLPTRSTLYTRHFPENSELCSLFYRMLYT